MSTLSKIFESFFLQINSLIEIYKFIKQKLVLIIIIINTYYILKNCFFINLEFVVLGFKTRQ